MQVTVLVHNNWLIACMQMSAGDESNCILKVELFKSTGKYFSLLKTVSASMSHQCFTKLYLSVVFVPYRNIVCLCHCKINDVLFSWHTLCFDVLNQCRIMSLSPLCSFNCVLSLCCVRL